MNLTTDDLQAIQKIVQTTVRPMIGELANDTAAGFAEVHEKFAKVDEQLDSMQTDLNRIENKLDPTIEKVDNHGVRLARLEPKAA